MNDLNRVVWGLAILLLMATQAYALESERERQLVNLVNQAVQVIHAEGESAFQRFAKKGTMWRQSDTYIFVGDTDGTMLFNGGDRSLEGQNLMNLKDVNGKFFIKAFIDTVTTTGSGWVEYMWPKPGETKPARKMSYVKEATLGDKTLFVGAGFYAESGEERERPSSQIREGNVAHAGAYSRHARLSAEALGNAEERRWPASCNLGEGWRPFSASC